MTRREIGDLVGQLGDIVATLRNADPSDKAAVYRQLGLHLRYDPGQQKVRAEARLGQPRGAMVGVEGGT
jgi:site-specific DNA recombinase